jgi:hypothetical protein
LQKRSIATSTNWSLKPIDDVMVIETSSVSVQLYSMTIFSSLNSSPSQKGVTIAKIGITKIGIAKIGIPIGMDR